MNVSKQQGTSDCGLFAIAFAERILSGEDPCTVTYDQLKMRQHILDCLNAGSISAFPVRDYRVCRRTIALEYSVELFCICRRLYCKSDAMIQCAMCHEWYHAACIKMDMKVFSAYSCNRGRKYICFRCTD